MMMTDTFPQGEQVAHPNPVEFAAELRRLANDLLRDVRRYATLSGPSHLVAICPVHEMFLRSLSERVMGKATIRPSGDDESEPNPTPGYL